MRTQHREGKQFDEEEMVSLASNINGDLSWVSMRDECEEERKKEKKEQKEKAGGKIMRKMMRVSVFFYCILYFLDSVERATKFKTKIKNPTKHLELIIHSYADNDKNNYNNDTDNKQFCCRCRRRRRRRCCCCLFWCVRVPLPCSREKPES